MPTPIAMLAIVFACGVARAADPPLLLPGAPLIVEQAGTLELWAPELGEDARVRGRSDLARVGTGVPAGDGRWLVPVTPTGDGLHDVTVLLSLKDGDRRQEWTVSVPVRPDVAGALDVEAPSADSGHEVVVVPLGSSPVPLQDRRLLLHSRLGRLGPATPTDAGWRVPWEAPGGLDTPTWEIVTAADAMAPTTVVGWSALPITRPTTVQAEVRPGASCRLTAGDVVTDATEADSAGHVALTVDLHPSVARGELRCVLADDERVHVLPLPAGQGPTIALMPLPERLPAGARVPVQAAVIEADGQPRTAGSGPVVEGVGELRLVAAGLFSGTWTVPEETGPIELRATLRDASDVLPVTVVAPGSPSAGPPVQVVAWSATPAVPTAEGSVVVLASALDAFGLPIPRAVFEPIATGSHLKPRRIVAGRDGRAAVRLTLDEGATLPSLRLDSGGLSDTAVVLVTDNPPTAPAGSGPDRVRNARAALANDQPAPADQPAVGATTARAAAGDVQAVARVDEAPTRADRGDPWLRLALSAGTVPHAWSQAAVEGDQGIPGKITSRQGDLFAGDPQGAFGLDVRARAIPAGLPVGADLRLQARQETYNVVGTSFSRLDLQLAAGMRAPVPLGSRATPFVVVQAVAFRTPLFSYDYFRADEPSKAAGADMVTTTVVGGRLGGGVDLSLGDTLVDLELSETLAPWPIDTRVGAAVDHAVIDQLALRAAIELSFRSMEFDVGVDRAQVYDQQHQLMLGLVYLAR